MDSRAPQLTLSIVLLVAFLLGTAGNVEGGEVPSSAYSSSILVPGVFLDHHSFLFRYPHQTTDLDTQILTLATTSSYSSDPFGVGANLRSDRVGGFLLSQSLTTVNTTAIVDLLQTGIGMSWGRVRSGVAIRYGRDRSFFSDTNDIFGETTVSEVDQKVDYREGALGLGFTSDRFGLDGVLEVYREDLDVQSVRVRRIDTAIDTTELVAEADPAFHLAGSIRGRIDTGQSSRFTFFSSFQVPGVRGTVKSGSNG